MPISSAAWRAHWRACFQAHQQGAFLRPPHLDAWRREQAALDHLGQAHRWRAWRRAGVVVVVLPPLMVAAALTWHWSPRLLGLATVAAGLLATPWAFQGSECWGTRAARTRRHDLERAPMSRLAQLHGPDAERWRHHLSERAGEVGLLEGDLRQAQHALDRPTRSQYVPAQVGPGWLSTQPPTAP